VPLSQAARDAVRAVTARNPRDAQRLLDKMRIAPETTRRRPTRFGPLTIVILGLLPVQSLPPDEIRLCETLGAEWQRGDFEIHELADAIEIALREVTGRRQDPRRQHPGGWRTLAGMERAPGRLLGPN
jgi:hypothetical protein